MSGLLYISYTGMLEPLGQSQVISYLERLSDGDPIHLVSFEKPAHFADRVQRDGVAARLLAAGIKWHPLHYHKRPSSLATAYDVIQGIAVGLWLSLRNGLTVVHARGYVPAVMALALKRAAGRRFIFDMRGFWPDERVDGGIWGRNSVIYRIAKRFERRLLLAADRIVVLTKAAAEEIRRFPYLAARAPAMTIIPTCANLDRFSPARTPGADGFVLGYVGSVGNWYDFDSTARLFRYLKRRRPDARMVVVNRGEHDLVHRAMAAAGVDRADYDVVAAHHLEVPNLIRTMTSGVLIARPAYSHLGRSPVKLAEFLGCGVPCLVNAGVGDTEDVILENRVGVVIAEASEAEIERGVDRLLDLVAEPDLRDRCVATAAKVFSLDQGVAAYRALYRSLNLSMANVK